MAGRINSPPAIHGSTVTDSSTVNDSTSQLQGARPVPVHSVLAAHQDASPSLPPSGNAPDLRHARVRQALPVSVRVASCFGEKAKTKALKHWMDSSKPRAEQTYHYLLDAARNLKECARRSLWKQSFALIVRHMPGSYEYERFYSLRGQHPAANQQKLTVKQTDEIMAAVAASGNEASLPHELNNDVGRLVTGYLKWRKEKGHAAEPIIISWCMKLLKSLHRGVYSSNSMDENNSIHAYLADIVSDKDAALSESAQLERQSPPLAVFMYKLMEHIDLDLSDSLKIDTDFLYGKPELCALLAATRQGRIEVTEALTKNGGKAAQLQQQLLPLLQHDRVWTIDHLPDLKKMHEYQLQHLLPLLQHDQTWTTEHLSQLKEMDGYQLKQLLPLLQHDQAWTTEHLSQFKEMHEHQLQHLFPLLQHDQTWTTEHLSQLKEMDGYQLKQLLPLLQHGQAWTTDHLPHLKKMRAYQLQHLLPLLLHDQAWASEHLSQLKEMHEYQLQQLLPLLQHDQAWTTDHLPHLNKMDGHQLKQLLPLLQHDKAWTIDHLPHLKKIMAYRLQHLLPLLQHDQTWTTDHFPHLKKMHEYQLQHLLPLLQHDQTWTTDHFPHLKKMHEYQLQHLLPLLQHDQTWTTDHLSHLKEMNGSQLQHLLPLLQYDKAWATGHLSQFKEMNGSQLQYLLPLLQYNQAWTADDLSQLKEMSEYQLKYLLPLLQHDRAWTVDHLPHLKKMSRDQLKKLSRFFHLKLMDVASERFNSAANPYVRESLSIKNQDIKELTIELGRHGASGSTSNYLREALSIKNQDRDEATILKTHGASRSTFHSEAVIASYLTERFKNNYQKIPAATFGVENEMFIPGIPEASSSEIKDELNEKLGTKSKRYHYVEDGSLNTDTPFVTPPIEQVTSILDSPEDVQRLQSALSILNDWGAFTNHTAGVHIHTGIGQWKAADCLNTLEEKNKNRFLPKWDQDLPGEFPGTTKITPYQLLFMKQFLVNMVAMQKDFYLVSRKSKYSMPNGPRNGDDLDKYYQDVSSAHSYEELSSLANANERCLNVNLEAYQKHGTIEVRGFTKKNSASMEVDPNLPVRDLIFMQDVLIKVANETKNILLSDASPEDSIKVRPSEGLTEMVKEYVQDVFLLEIVHVLGQRNPEKRMQTMDAIVKDKDLITSETLQKIRESQTSLFEGDPLARHFLAALDRDEQWNPSSVEKKALRRINSLRSMADAGLSVHASKP